MRIKTLLIFLFFGCGFYSLNAQLYHYEKYDIEKGLSQVNVNSLYEDEMGFLWIGTLGGGVCKFNGQYFQNYSEKEGIPGELVTSITQSANKRLIVGSTWGGVSENKEGRFVHYEPALSYSGTNHILTFKNETFLASGSGLFWLDGRQMIKTSEEEMQNKSINFLTNDDKYLYALSYKEIFIVEPNSKTLYKSIKLNLPTEASIVKIHKDKIYIGTKGSGIYYTTLRSLKNLPNDSRVNLLPLNNNKEFKVNFIYVDEGDVVWAGINDRKLYNIYDDRLVENKNFSFLIDGDFTTMLIDRGGTIWLGTDAMGLLKIINPVFINYKNHPFLNNPNLFALTSDEDGNVWVGSRSHGMVVHSDEKGILAEFNDKNKFPLNFITLQYHNGLVYAGTENGIYTIDSKTYKQVGKIILPGKRVKSIAFFENGTIAAGTSGEGLILLDEKNNIREVIDEKSGFIHNHIHYLLMDKQERLWIGTGNGIAYYVNGKMKILDNANLCNTYVGCITQDLQDNIWFSTDRCLMRYDGLKFEKFDRSSGLASNTLYLVKCDSKNNVWVGSNAGLNRLKLGPYGKVEKIDHFSMDDGFIGNECNSRGVYENKKGELYFCTIAGLIKYVGGENYKTACNHSVLINNVGIYYTRPVFDELSHGELKKGTSIYTNPVFNYHQNHLTFNFLCTEKCKPNEISFSFMLENFDQKWSPPSKSSSATYSNLPPGTYTFKVRTLDKNLQPTGITDSYSFTIKAAFWQKPWFYIIVAIVFFAILAYLKFRTEQREEIQRIQLEKKVNQRTIELLRQKEERELLLKEIHHRVKNNLQIINSLINLQAGQIRDAESLKVFEECKNRIKSMAIIHTKFYESTDFSKIDLADYVKELVKDLIHTYNVNKKIDLVCNINSIQMGIDTVIPVGLILNEIISNSLKYAFTTVEHGIIEISLKRNLDSGEFEMIVGDNGGGFDKKRFDAGSNDSLGLELIHILSEQLNGTVTLLDTKGTYYKVLFYEIDKQRSPISA